MSWQVKFDDEHRVIFLYYGADISKKDIRESIVAVVEIIRDKDVRKILTDFTECLSLSLSTFDIYQLPTEYKTAGLNVSVTEAIVAPQDPKILNDIKFYETVFLNRGVRVQIFEDREKALEWLINRKSLLSILRNDRERFSRISALR